MPLLLVAQYEACRYLFVLRRPAVHINELKDQPSPYFDEGTVEWYV